MKKTKIATSLIRDIVFVSFLFSLEDLPSTLRQLRKVRGTGLLPVWNFPWQAPGGYRMNPGHQCSKPDKGLLPGQTGCCTLLCTSSAVEFVVHRGSRTGNCRFSLQELLFSAPRLCRRQKFRGCPVLLLLRRFLVTEKIFRNSSTDRSSVDKLLNLAAANSHSAPEAEMSLVEPSVATVAITPLSLVPVPGMLLKWTLWNPETWLPVKCPEARTGRRLG